MALASYLHGEDDDNNYLTGQADPNTTSFVNDEADSFSGRNLPSVAAPAPKNDSGVFGTPTGADTPVPPVTAEEAERNVATLAGQRPVRPKVGFLRSLASIGVGLGAGYANASNPRLPQVDVGQAMDNVKFGGYNRKLDDWHKQVGDAQTAATAVKTGEAATTARAKEESETNLQNSEADYYRAHAKAILKDKPGTRYIKLPGSGGIYDTETDTIIGAKEAKTFVPIGAGGLYDPATDTVIGGAPKPPREISNSNVLKVKGNDGKTHLMLPDLQNPGDPSKMQDLGIAPDEKTDPMALLLAREDAQNKRHDQDEQRRLADELSAADKSKGIALTQAEAKAEARKVAVEQQFNGINLKPGQRRLTADQRNQAIAEIADELQKEKQLTQNSWESTYGQHNRPIPHKEFVNPLLDKGPGVPPPVGAPAHAAPPAVAPPPAGGPPVDPRVKAYADQYFGGDIAKAKNAIALQRGGR